MGTVSAARGDHNEVNIACTGSLRVNWDSVARNGSAYFGTNLMSRNGLFPSGRLKQASTHSSENVTAFVRWVVLPYCILQHLRTSEIILQGH